MEFYSGLLGFVLLLAVFTWRKLITSEKYSVDSYFHIMIEKAVIENKLSEIEAESILHAWSHYGFNKVTKSYEIRQILIENSIQIPLLYKTIGEKDLYSENQLLEELFEYFKKECIDHNN